jgi:hypothetical protein
MNVDLSPVNQTVKNSPFITQITQDVNETTYHGNESETPFKCKFNYNSTKSADRDENLDDQMI